MVIIKNKECRITYSYLKDVLFVCFFIHNRLIFVNPKCGLKKMGLVYLEVSDTFKT